MSQKEVSENVSLLGKSYTIEGLKELASQVATGKYTGELQELRNAVKSARGGLAIADQESEVGRALTNLDRAISMQATASKEGELRSKVLRATGEKIGPGIGEPPRPHERFIETKPSVTPGELGYVLAPFMPVDKNETPIPSGVNALREVLSILAVGAEAAEISDAAALDAANGLLNDTKSVLGVWHSQFTGSDAEWKEFTDALGSGDPKKIKTAFAMYYENTSDQFQNNIIKAGLEGTYFSTGKALFVFSSGISYRFSVGEHEGDAFEYVAFSKQKKELVKKLESINEKLEQARTELKQKQDSGVSGKLLEHFTKSVTDLEVKSEDLNAEIDNLDKKASWKVFCLLKVADQVLSLETKKLEEGQLVAADPTYLHEITGLVDFEFEAYSLGTGRRLASFHIGVEAGEVVATGPIGIESSEVLKARVGVSWYINNCSQTTSLTLDTNTSILTPGEAGTDYSLYLSYRGEILAISTGMRGFIPFEKITREAIPNQAFISLRGGEGLPLLGKEKTTGINVDATLLVYKEIPGIVDTRPVGGWGALAGFIFSYPNIVSLTLEGGAVPFGTVAAPFVGFNLNFGPTNE